MARGWRGLERRMALLAFIAAVLIHMGLSVPALAAGPQARVKDTLDGVSAVLNDSQLQGSDKAGERKERVRKLIFDAFDFEEMAKLALGGHWEKLTPQQRAEFVGLFGDLFERSYNRLVLQFLAGRKTSYGKESIDKDHAAVQTTLVVPKTEEQLPVEYRLIEKHQRWAVFDVVVDGMSIAGTYRAQFDKILRTSSYESLAQKIKTKLAEGPS